MRTRIILASFMFLAWGRGRAQSSLDVQNYIQAYKDLAIREMQRSGVPASITLAQGIHETLAGTSDLVRQSNNHFGIKCKEGWTGSVVYHDDDSRGECFRGYNSSEDSYRDHSDFLKNSSRYSSLFKLDPMDYEGWANGLRKAGYATNPRYPEILVRLIKEYNLQQYTLVALGGYKGPSDENPSFLKDSARDGTMDGYPPDPFVINHSKVIFARQGTSLLAVSDQYGMTLSNLLDFNDLGKQEDILQKDQLLFLQRKRKQGAGEFHIVRAGETVYEIGQQEGIRYESLMNLNQLNAGDQPAVGEKLYLQAASPFKPQLVLSTQRQPKPGQEMILNKN
jgi:LysM repeat protein